MTRAPFALPAPNQPLGTIWTPEPPESEGPLARDMKKLTDGLIRVEKVCRTCGTLFEGWMFVAMYQKRVKSGDIDPDRPHHVGKYQACDDCVRIWENETKITHLEYEMERLEARWEKATTVTKRVPIVDAMVRDLKQLVDLVTFGSPKFERYGEQLNVLTDWLHEHRAPAEKLPGSAGPAEAP